MKVKQIDRNLLYGLVYVQEAPKSQKEEEAAYEGANAETKEDKEKDKEDLTYLILGDHKSFYKVNVGNFSCTEFKDQNCVGIQYLDNNYLYTMAHKSKSKRSGLRLYDIRNVVQSNKDFSYSLSSVA